VAAASTETDTDAELAALLAATGRGDQVAFERLYALTSSQLFGVVLRSLRQRDQAIDVLQESYLRIWTHAARYQPERGAPLAWMTTIARNRALDWRRALPSHVSLDDDPHDVSDGAGGAVVSDPPAGVERVRLQRCLETLPEAQRDCIVLAYVGGYSHDELARRLDRPVGTVKSWIRRGLARLKACLEP